MFCARSLLDEFMERARSTQLPFNETDSLAPSQVEEVVEALMRSQVDSHMFHLCCRGLERSCQALQVNFVSARDSVSLSSDLQWQYLQLLDIGLVLAELWQW